MSVPVPDDSTLNGALHLLVDVVAGQIAQLDPASAAALHKQVDVQFPPPVVQPPGP